MVDDTGFAKKGTHSVGVARQYCGQVGKQENCRVAVSLSVSTERAVCPLLGACTCRRVGQGRDSEKEDGDTHGDSLSDQAGDRTGTDSHRRKARDFPSG